MDRRRFSKGAGFIAAALLLCSCGLLLHPNFQRDSTELIVDPAIVKRVEWSESSWSQLKPSKKLKWVDCYSGGYECTRLEVPLDYNNTEEDSAVIALVRLPANVSSDSEEYRGPILFNPGGPGGSGVDLLRNRGTMLRTLLGPQFDLVGFDPRGVSRSTPRVEFYESRSERQLWARSSLRQIGNHSETVATAWARNKITGDLALQRDHNVLAHINTDHTARDMLTITEAHGREKLQYWGFSYGTVLGSTFAAMFPDKVERLIIDGVVDVPDDYYTANWTENLLDTDKVLQWFFHDCLKAGPDSCAFYESSVEAMSEKLNRIYDSVLESPIPVRTNQSYGLVDFARVRQFMFMSFYSPFAWWPPLAAALQDLATTRNGTAFYQLLEAQSFSCDCDPLKHAFDGVSDAQTAIACNDGDVVPDTLEHAQAFYKNILKVSEWGSLWAGLHLSCAAWPKIPKTQFRGPIAGNTSFPLLVIGNKADPVTPLSAAHKVSKGFPGSVVLSQNSAGHCSLSAPSACVARYVRDYFVNGTLPEPGTWCEIDASPFDAKRLANAAPVSVDGEQTPLKYDSEQEDTEFARALRDLAMFKGDGRVHPLHI